MLEAVVDASIVAAILFGEDEADEALARIAGFDRVAPDLLIYEFTNIAVTKRRRNPGESESIRIGFEKLDELDIALFPVDRHAAFRVANQERLSAYDASYLVLAATRGAKLITFDRALESAARRLLSSPS
jgi:predicted nucleic acid-binding protein